MHTFASYIMSFVYVTWIVCIFFLLCKVFQTNKGVKNYQVCILKTDPAKHMTWEVEHLASNNCECNYCGTADMMELCSQRPHFMAMQR